MEERKLCLFLERKDVPLKMEFCGSRSRAELTQMQMQPVSLQGTAGSLDLGTWCPWALVAGLIQILTLREVSLTPQLDIRFL